MAPLLYNLPNYIRQHGSVSMPTLNISNHKTTYLTEDGMIDKPTAAGKGRHEGTRPSLRLNGAR